MLPSLFTLCRVFVELRYRSWWCTHSLSATTTMRLLVNVVHPAPVPSFLFQITTGRKLFQRPATIPTDHCECCACLSRSPCSCRTVAHTSKVLPSRSTLSLDPEPQIKRYALVLNRNATLITMPTALGKASLLWMYIASCIGPCLSCLQNNVVVLFITSRRYHGGNRRPVENHDRRRDETCFQNKKNTI